MNTYRYCYNEGNELQNYDDLKSLDVYDEFLEEVQPLSKEQFDICLSKSGRYIFRNKENKAYCTACDSHFEFVGGKHKEMVHCPNCGKELQLHNTWRTKSLPQWHDWYAFVEKVKGEENTILIRYILTRHMSDGKTICQEDARVIWNIAIDNEVHYEWDYDADYQKFNWVNQNTQYFNYYRSMAPNSFICTGAEWNEGYLDLLQSLPCFKYIDLKELNYEGFSTIAKYASVVEKFQKLGLSKFIVNWLESWFAKSMLDTSQNSIYKMLRITKNDFHFLKENQSVDVLKFLQSNPNTNQKALDNFLLFGEYGLERISDKCSFYHLKKGKVISYIKRKVIAENYKYSDYLDYLDTIDKLAYPIDNQYAYPKDFRKAKEDSIAKRNEQLERLKNLDNKEIALEEAKKDEKIYLISKALRESKELQKWFDGSNGLKVFVPESVGELVDESVKMHNCLSNYANRIANNECLIFFIRKIDEPDKEYIAMEYSNGVVQQIRLDNNVEVTDAKIINFADALAKKLNQINVRETIVKEVIRKVA